ncbi:alpha/beta hydrolase [Streptomyces chattanoogensis]|uniref:alpha/beta hydrolase n=1 Tax=Streptomyces chattanoogensis TaxID=66876 RepID=UPI0012FF377B|nr:alpha/beta hydrolase [Streptomyces chattanoogensis]
MTTGALAVATLVVTGCGVSDAAAARPGDAKDMNTSVPVLPARFTQQKVQWTACGKDVTPDAVPGAECGWVKVPVDYAAPDGQTVKLRVSRVQAKEPGRRLGSLLYNPGGPGAGGAADVADGNWQAGEQARARYDLVGFDPRGTAGSGQIKCPDGVVQEPENPPRTEAEAAKAFADASRRAQACRKASGAVLAHMDSVSVARDLDVLRTVLGDAKLNYTGISYGTFIGQQYMKLFPRKVGRMVLDGVVNPAADIQQVARLDAKTSDDAMRRYAQDLVARGDDRLGATAEEVVRRVTGFARKLEHAPLQGTDGEKFTDATLSTYLGTAVTARESWKPLTKALVAAVHGDGAAFERFDAETAGESGGEKPTPQEEQSDENMSMSLPAVLCLDSPSAPKSPKKMLDTADAFARQSPLFGRYYAWQMIDCATWPIAPTGVAEPVKASGAAPVLLVSYTDDVQTPLQNAQAVHRQLDNSSLLVRKGQGHGAYASEDPSTCTDRAVDRYLVGGKLPDRAANCPR